MNNSGIQFMMILSIVFQLEEGSIFRHKGERKIRIAEDDTMSVADSIGTENDTIDTNSIDGDSDNDSDNSSDSDNEEDKNDNKLQTLKEDSEDELCSDSKVKVEGSQVALAEKEVKVEGSKVEKQEDKDSSEDDNAAFPDTSISLQHVKGDK